MREFAIQDAESRTSMNIRKMELNFRKFNVQPQGFQMTGIE